MIQPSSEHKISPIPEDWFTCLVIVGSALREEQRRLRDLETQQDNLDNRLMELQKESAMSKVRGEGDD